MALARFSIVAGLVFALGGCVAAPLAQMAVSQMAPAKPACTGCTNGAAAPGSFADMSKGFGDSFQMLLGTKTDGPAAGGAAGK